VREFDSYSLLLVRDRQAQLIYKHAVSTIMPGEPVRIPQTSDDQGMSAWLFTILRNLFYSQHRRAKHEVPDPDGSYAGQLRTAPDQGARCDVQDLRKALTRLSPEHREALILVAAEGLSYGEAAQVCGVAIGTIKSRVHRGRMRLAELLALHDAESFGPDEVMQAALQHAM
jgi:RNA polymerase sigma-70 factor, ECF subfamily